MSSFSENFVPTVVTLTIGGVVLAMLVSVGSCVRHDSDKYYETVNICLSTGGTWVDDNKGAYSGICIRGQTTLEK